MLWREKCKEEGITSNLLSTSPILPQASASRVRRKSSTYSLASVTSSLSSGSCGNSDAPSKSPWKSLYMRQYQIEQNWRHGSVRPYKVSSVLTFFISHIYRPHPKDGEGTVFTGACLSTGVGGYPGRLVFDPRSFPGEELPLVSGPPGPF